MKRCCGCKLEKALAEFGKWSRGKDGLQTYCRQCQSQYAKRNRERLNVTARRLYNPEKEKIRRMKEKSRRKENDRLRYIRQRETLKAKSCLYGKSPDVKARRNILRKKRRETDVGYRIENRLRVRLHQALHGSLKVDSTKNLVGCSIDTLKNVLQNHFSDGMTWENIGKWHIDHIVPCAQFDLSDPDQQRECFHYTNLQPLWAVDNLRKHATTQKREPSLTNQYLN